MQRKNITHNIKIPSVLLSIPMHFPFTKTRDGTNNADDEGEGGYSFCINLQKGHMITKRMDKSLRLE